MKINILHWPADPAVKIDVHTFDIVFVSARHDQAPQYTFDYQVDFTRPSSVIF